MIDKNYRYGDAKTDVFGSDAMLQPATVDRIPDGPTTPQIAYQMVKDETFAQTQPRLNLATFVTTYMDEYATKLMNEAININYIDETEYPRIAVMNGKCINIIANLWNTPETNTWKTGALAIGSSEACMLGGIAAWIRWRERRQKAGKPFDKPNFVISTGYQVVWEKFAQLWQIEMRTVPLTLEKTTLDPQEALKMCDENTICIVPIQGVTWTGLNDDVEALDKALDEYNAKTGYEIPIHVDAASGGFILPFLDPDRKWDFRLKWVLSISTSGHKFGLVYPGLGWVVWKDKKYLPDVMSFSVNYLGAEIAQVGLNFSRPAAQILGQYYQFIRLGFEGYKNIQYNSLSILRRGAQPDIHMADETGIPENGQVDSVRPSGQACAEGLDGAGLHAACQHTECSGDASALQAGFQPRYGRPAPERYSLRDYRAERPRISHHNAHRYGKEHSSGA